MTAQGRISAPPLPGGRLTEIQGLRALAAGLVVAEHTRDQLAAAATPWAAVEWGRGLGAWGVDLFFVISGYIIARTAAKVTPGWSGALAFGARRLWRIAPTYWFWSMLWFAWISARTGTLEWLPLLKSFVFFPVTLGNQDVLPVLFVGWSLSYEILFYLVMALGLALRVPLALFLLSAAGLAAAATGTAWAHSSAWGGFLANPLWLEFAAGMLLFHGEAWLRQRGRVFAGVALAAGLAGWLASAGERSSLWADCQLILVNQHSWDRVVGWGLPAVAVAAGTLAWGCPHPTGLLSRWAQALGDASYAWYLTHLFALLFVARVWRTLWPGEAPLLFLVSAFLASLVLALAAYRWLEQPLQRRSPFSPS